MGRRFANHASIDQPADCRAIEAGAAADASLPSAYHAGIVKRHLHRLVKATPGCLRRSMTICHCLLATDAALFRISQCAEVVMHDTRQQEMTRHYASERIVVEISSRQPERWYISDMPAGHPSNSYPAMAHSVEPRRGLF